MIFIETAIYQQDVDALLSDEEHGALQQYLAANPDAGDLIPKSGGLRKVRVAVQGRGKRGGARVIYYWRRSESQILLLAIYAKARASDLTSQQLKALRTVVERWK